MAKAEVHDIVIVGGGIGGLALSLGLHRKGIKSLVLERSKVLRSEGAAMGVHGNGWHALDQLKVGTDLRNCSIALTGMHYEYVSKDDKNVKTYRRELRCLRRKELIETLARYVPAEQMRFGCQVTSLDFDHRENLHILTTRDGSIIKAKVLIGCDGLYSVVGKALQLAPPKYFPIWITRGFTTYPEGHPYGSHFLRLATPNNTIFGRLPIDDKNIHFFVTHFDAPAGDMTDPEVVKEYTLKILKGSPSEVMDAVTNCDMETLSMRQASYRSPWALLNQNFRKGTMTVAGDSMHVMGPFIGQGGSAALEDAIVLTRCLSNAIKTPADASSDKNWTERVEDAIDLYIKERRPRLMRLAIQSYLVGTLLSTKSWVGKLVVIFLLSVFFGGNNLNHALFDCGTI
ncbi:3-hydroxybenzoate 6-hydroxylase 1 [Rhynchospora pubera]|uniref:3-hydroxybenzoate 6-hydroxylase 1 n=1 Tax=Rhynchospora pubera TaxID=906938 RepID=A0AAV8FHK7_9POAL|nr:3-hydroxybenzoate 6-hydroxylase 1 [Rhynchospora pubera]